MLNPLTSCNYIFDGFFAKDFLSSYMKLNLSPYFFLFLEKKNKFIIGNLSYSLMAPFSLFVEKIISEFDPLCKIHGTKMK